MSYIAAVQERVDRGYDVGEVDEAALERFLAGAAHASQAQREAVAAKMVARIRRGERATGTTIATMGETVRRLRAM